jgi:hypothetical protein
MRVVELKEFAIFIYQELRNRGDAEVHYESLRVGVGLDIGISEAANDGHWFVNEVTQAFDADQFPAHHLPYPHTLVAEAFSEAFGRHCTRSP